MSKEQPVFESTATYYNETFKKWKTGRFILNERYIMFCSDEYETLRIPLSTMSSLEKRQSSLIYAAIVVSVASEKHWFASLPNRDSLYNLLELFWREALLSKEHKTSPAPPKSGTTDLGKDLLNLLHESETTLVNAANSLSDQGKQIEETQATVSDINTDLNVAERFLRSMSFPQTLLQLSNITGSNLAEQQVLQKCFKVTYTFSETLNDNCYWDRGTLFFGEDITLVDERKVNQLSVNTDEVISCQVISSWKLRLVYSAGNVEKSCHIMCPQLFKLLKYLNSHPTLREKVVYLDDIHSPSTSLVSYSRPSTSGSLDFSFSPSLKKTEGENLDSNMEQMQENSDMISDEDIQEISNMLTNLQALAVEVNKEQHEQMEKINSLMSTVEKTDLRMKADTKKIKKLI